MARTTYAIPAISSILNHFPALQPLLRDGDGPAGRARSHESDFELLMQAKIRSGDYLTALTSELESLLAELQASGSPQSADVDRLVSELRYLEDHFALKKKK